MDRKEYEEIREGLIEDLKPSTQAGVRLVEALAYDLMRLRYILAMEMARLDPAPDGCPQKGTAGLEIRLNGGRKIEEMEAAAAKWRGISDMIESGECVSVSVDELPSIVDAIWEEITGCEAEREVREEELAEYREKLLAATESRRRILKDLFQEGHSSLASYARCTIVNVFSRVN